MDSGTTPPSRFFVVFDSEYRKCAMLQAFSQYENAFQDVEKDVHV